MSLKCIVQRNDFIEGLGSLQNITSKRGTLAVLSNILIEATSNGLVLTATDLEVGVKLFVPAEVAQIGSLTLPSKKIFEIVRESGSDDISIEETENSWVKIQAGASTYNLAGIASEEFPAFPEFDEDSFTSFEAFIFLDLIDTIQNNPLLASQSIAHIRETIKIE